MKIDKSTIFGIKSEKLSVSIAQCNPDTDEQIVMVVSIPKCEVPIIVELSEDDVDELIAHLQQLKRRLYGKGWLRLFCLRKDQRIAQIFAPPRK